MRWIEGWCILVRKKAILRSNLCFPFCSALLRPKSCLLPLCCQATHLGGEHITLISALPHVTKHDRVHLVCMTHIEMDTIEIGDVPVCLQRALPPVLNGCSRSWLRRLIALALGAAASKVWATAPTWCVLAPAPNISVSP